MMCGIAGIYNLSSRCDPRSTYAVNMRDSLLHRGPDDQGIFFSPDQRLFLVNTRLSIIDLTSSGHQPMSDIEAKVWISYNGEIYNYSELRNELRMRGYSFRSNSDTEVIINGFKEWGIESLLRRLRGMFAFAIYDLRTERPRLILARDRFGIKPLYYCQDDKLLLFASEVKAIVKSGLIRLDYNHEADIAFLLFGYIPAPFTNIKNVFSLPAGSYLLIEGDQKITAKYYNLIDKFSATEIKESANFYDQIRSMLDEVVRLHLISDAPLGVFLSGGIDSSALVALASKFRDTSLTTLSVVFDEEKYSELSFQKMVTERYRTDHRQIKVTEDDFYAEIDNIFGAMDQPTNNGINTYFVSRAAKQAGLKAVLSGLGGDEVFCGYDSFKRMRLLKKLSGLSRACRLPFALAGIFNDRWRKLTYLKDANFLDLYLVFRGFFIPHDVARILDTSEREVHAVLDNFRLSAIGPQLSSLSPVDWLSFMELDFYLKNQLLRDTDAMSMCHSVETRVPYLDHILVDYVASLKSELKFSRGNTPKPLLVRPLKDMLPHQVIFRKKQGFTFPFDLWLRRGGRGLLEAAVAKGRINQEYADVLWRKFTRGAIHWSRIWALIVMGGTR